MAKQPIPNVTDEDVQRIALRDFGETQLPLVMSILGEFERQEWSCVVPRVQLSILKIAQGDLDRLLNATELAIADYRNALVNAEFPRYAQETYLRNVSEDVKQELIDDDWRQYCEWFGKELAKQTK
jgi:hypothetical protein